MIRRLATAQLVVLALACLIAAAAPAQDCFPYWTTSRFKGACDLPGAPLVLAAHDDLVFALTAEQLVAVDVADPAAPAVLGSVPHALDPVAAAAGPGLLVVADRTGALAVFDVSDPAAPQLLHTVPVPGTLADVAVTTDPAGVVVVASSAALLVLTMDPGGDLTLAGTLALDDPPLGVAAWSQGRVVATTALAVLVVGIADPAQPVVQDTLTPVTDPDHIPWYAEVEVCGDRWVLTAYEDMPVQTRERDWGDPFILETLDLGQPDPQATLRYWMVGDSEPLRLLAACGEHAVTIQGSRLAIVDLAAAPAGTGGLAPVLVLDAGSDLEAACAWPGGVAVAGSDSRLRTVPGLAPVTVPAAAVFGDQERATLHGDAWASSQNAIWDGSWFNHLWRLTDPLQPELVASYHCQGGWDFRHGTRVEAVAGDLVLLESYDSSSTWWTLKDWAHPEAPAADVPTARTQAFFAGDLLVACGLHLENWSEPRLLEIVDVSDPATPTLRGAIEIDPAEWGRCAVDDVVYLVVDPESGPPALWAIDIADPDQPVHNGSLALASRLEDLRPWNGRLLGSDAAGLVVFDPDGPSLLGRFDAAGAPRCFQADGELVWLVSGSRELLAVDLSDPAAPVATGPGAPVPGSPQDLAVGDGVAYVACGPEGLQAYAIDEPAAPAWLGGGGIATDGVEREGTWQIVEGAVLPPDCGELVSVPDPDAPPARRVLTVAPNPFNPRTEIRFALPAAGPVDLAVFDLRGRLVRRLAGGILAAGEHAVVWDGQDQGGRAVASGTYVARLRATGVAAARKVQLVR